MRSTYRALYRLRLTPWDSAAIPAALATSVEGPGSPPPGLAVDLGCGTGAQARYLDSHGWSVTAVDYTPRAIHAARRLDPDSRVHWRIADVTDLADLDPDGRLVGEATLLLDNGCLHGIPDAHRPGWATTVQTLAASGCLLLIRAAPRHRGFGPGPAGLDADELAALLGERWHRRSPPEHGWYRYLCE